MPHGSVPGSLLARYAVATRARGGRFGDRSAREAGHSVEFLDYRPYQPGDDMRAVDWRAYARTGRAYTRLYHAERSTELHIVVDDSASMRLHGKHRWAAALARVLLTVGQHEASATLHLASGGSAPPVRSHRDVPAAWRYLDAATDRAAASPAPKAGRDSDDDGAPALPDLLARRVLALPPHGGAALVVVLSDLMDPGGWTPLFAATSARRSDLLLLQILHGSELDPDLDEAELVDVEDGTRLEAGAAEARAYAEAMRQFVARIRAAAAEAGHRHRVLRVPEEPARPGTPPLRRWRRGARRVVGAETPTSSDGDGSSAAFRDLVRSGVLVRR
ncbi:MAG: DUF58 domain-containing protein [Trueperaceae bacterium]